MLDVHTRVSDLYSSPYDQIAEQLRLTIEVIKERQEGELINNPEYGMLANCAPSQRIKTRTGAPTPDDLDELLTKVWKEPAFFLAHPRAIAAFGRECTRRGTPPPTISMFGSQFLTWRGLPLVPSDKVFIDAKGKTCILLLRVGAKRQGVVGLYQPGLTGEQSPGLAVRFSGINKNAIASYLISLYCSLAVLTESALAVLDDVAGRQVPQLQGQLRVTGMGAEVPFDLPDEATLARIAESFFGDLPLVEGGLAPAYSASGAPGPSGMPQAPAGSPGVPGLPAGLSPTDGIGLGGIDSDPKAAGSLPTKEMPDPATAAGLVREPYGPGSPLVTPPAVAPPSQFVPDESLLTRMASAFFTALPGTPAAGVPDVPRTAPASGPTRGGADVPSGGVPPVGSNGAVPSGTVAETSAPPSGALPPVGRGGADPASAMPVDPAQGDPGVDAGYDPSGFGGAPFDRPDFDLDLTHLAAALNPLDLSGPLLPGVELPGSELTNSDLAGLDVSVPVLSSVPALDLLSPPAAPPATPPSTPYYFLGETSTLPSIGGVDPGTAPATNTTSVTERAPATSREDAPGRGDFDGRDPGTGPGAPSAGTRPGIGVETGHDHSAHRTFDVHAVRRDFPILSEIVDGKPLVWMDNAATTQKPQAVIDRLATSTRTRTPTSTAPRTPSPPAPPTPTRPPATRLPASSARRAATRSSSCAAPPRPST